MKTLAIDSSLPAGSVAALTPQGISAELLPEVGTHARRIAAALRDLAHQQGFRPGEAELVAVVRGPGSFTGLRVGVATAKALAWASGAKLCGLSGFELIARRTSREAGFAGHPIHVAYDAGRGELFAAEVVPDSDEPSGWRARAGALIPADAWLAGLPTGSRVSGPGLGMPGTLATGIAARPDLQIAPREAWSPSAAEAGEVALLRAAAGMVDDPATLIPEYLRASYAQENDPRPSG